MLVELRIAAIKTDPYTNLPFILLTDNNDQQAFPIWVGIFEAGAIAAELEGIKLKRPMTHDLLLTAIEKLGGKIERVEIDQLKQSTFFAKLIINQGEEQITLDARPSDAIALALRARALIFAEQEVITKAGNLKPAAADLDKKKASKQDLKQLLEDMSEEDFGKYKQ